MYTKPACYLKTYYHKKSISTGRFKRVGTKDSFSYVESGHYGIQPVKWEGQPKAIKSNILNSLEFYL